MDLTEELQLRKEALSLCLSRSVSVSVSPSFTHTHTHFRSRALSLSLTAPRPQVMDPLNTSPPRNLTPSPEPSQVMDLSEDLTEEQQLRKDASEWVPSSVQSSQKVRPPPPRGT